MSIPRNNKKYLQENMHMRRTLPKYQRKQQAYDRLTQEMFRLTKRLRKEVTEEEFTIEACLKLRVSEAWIPQVFQSRPEGLHPVIVALLRHAFNKEGALVDPGPSIFISRLDLPFKSIMFNLLVREIRLPQDLDFKLCNALVRAVRTVYLVVPNTSRKEFAFYILSVYDHKVWRELLDQEKGERLEMIKDFIRRANYYGSSFKEKRAKRIWHEIRFVGLEKFGYKLSTIAASSSEDMLAVVEFFSASWAEPQLIIPDSLESPNIRGKDRQMPDYLL